MPAGPPADPRALERWFDAVAALLLGGVVMVAGGEVFRPLEIELYFSSDEHPDPFVHCDPRQAQRDTWYFHRRGGAYRGGSFKGLDITFGRGAFGGALIRTLRAADGAVTNGCSLCVDRLLAATGHDRVVDLDRALAGRSVWDAASPLCLRAVDRPATVWKTARVGLTLKRARAHPEMPRYLLRPYRYLSAPRAVKKGRLQLILALHAAGVTAAEIRAITGSPRRAIAGYIQDYERGRAIGSTARWVGASLTRADICQLHGAGSVAVGVEP